MNAVDWSIGWWRRRHDEEYFPAMDQHRDWRVYPAPPDYLLTLAGLRPDDDALEVGCGYGQWMVPVSRHVRRVFGVDIHTSLIDKADEAFEAHGVRNARVFLGDGKTLPFEDAAYSLVYCISVFQHIPREAVRGYFTEIHRVLRPGGRALLHFRYADGKGPYSRDIGVDHQGDFSVGWTAAEALAEAERVGWAAETHAGGDTLLLLGRPT